MIVKSILSILIGVTFLYMFEWCELDPVNDPITSTISTSTTNKHSSSTIDRCHEIGYHVDWSLFTDEALGRYFKDPAHEWYCGNQLNLSALGIKDLTGIEQFYEPGLRILDLSNNQISDIGPLLDFSGLYQLDLSDNSLQTLELSGFTNLKYVKVSNNPISDIMLKDLQNLSTFIFTRSIEGFLEIKTVYLENLPEFQRFIVANLNMHKGLGTILDRVELKNLAKFSGKDFSKDIDTHFEYWDDFEHIWKEYYYDHKYNYSINTVIVDNGLCFSYYYNYSLGWTDKRNVRSLSLTNVAGLFQLSIGNYYNEDLLNTVKISNLPDLKGLGMRNNKYLIDVTIEEVPNLKEMDLSYCNLYSVSLWDFPSLEVLNLSYNVLDSTSTLSITQCPNLLELDLSSNAFTDSAPIAINQLDVLQKLNLMDNQLRFISSLSAFPSLRFLDLRGNDDLDCQEILPLQTTALHQAIILEPSQCPATACVVSEYVDFESLAIGNEYPTLANKIVRREIMDNIHTPSGYDQFQVDADGKVINIESTRYTDTLTEDCQQLQDSNGGTPSYNEKGLLTSLVDTEYITVQGTTCLSFEESKFFTYDSNNNLIEEDYEVIGYDFETSIIYEDTPDEYIQVECETNSYGEFGCYRTYIFECIDTTE